MERFSEKEPYCLVLSGGGAKGIYHIGAWRALRELKVPVNAFIGNSIGAIIAGYLAQEQYEALEHIGSTINIETIMKVPQELVVEGNFKLDPKKLKSFQQFTQSVMKRKGIDTSPMRQILNKDIDEKKVRKKGHDLGVVTVNISEMKPKEVFLDEMEEGALIDYILASSAFPGFERPQIKGKKFIDGGIFDNIPYNLARKRGYKRIIVLDMSGMGVNKRPSIQGSQTIYIKNSMNFQGTFEFDRKKLNRFRELGYLDTLKTFNRLKGFRYFLKPNENREKSFQKNIRSEAGYDLLREHFDICGGHPSRENLRRFLPSSLQRDPQFLYLILDQAASAVGVERVKDYSYSELEKAIEEHQQQIENQVKENYQKMNSKQLKVWTKKFQKISEKFFADKEILEPPYYYHYLLHLLFKGDIPGFIRTGILKFSPETEALLFLKRYNKFFPENQT